MWASIHSLPAGVIIQCLHFILAHFLIVQLNSFLGRTQEGGASANVLQEIQLPVIANNECKDAYAAKGKLISEKQFDDAVMCAGYKEGGRDTCNG